MADHTASNDHRPSPRIPEHIGRARLKFAKPLYMLVESAAKCRFSHRLQYSGTSRARRGRWSWLGSESFVKRPEQRVVSGFTFSALQRCGCHQR